MKRYFKFILLPFLLLIYAEGLCSDSAYIHISWNREQDKPYHEFVFYKKGGYNPEQKSSSSFKNPFISQIALSEKEFEKIKNLLFAEYNDPDSSEQSDPLLMSYYIGYFEGSKWVLTNFMNNKADFIRISKLVSNFFKGTEFQKEVKTRWLLIFDRLGIKTNG